MEHTLAGVYVEYNNRPLPLHEYVVGPVHHDLADLGILQQELDGTEADDLVRHLVDQPGEVSGGKYHSVVTKDRQGLLANPEAAVRGRRLPEQRWSSRSRTRVATSAFS